MTCVYNNFRFVAKIHYKMLQEKLQSQQEEIIKLETGKIKHFEFFEIFFFVLIC